MHLRDEYLNVTIGYVSYLSNVTNVLTLLTATLLSDFEFSICFLLFEAKYHKHVNVPFERGLLLAANSLYPQNLKTLKC